MPRGGARPGAGRKPKAEKWAALIARAEKKIRDRLPLLIDNLFLLADGVQVREVRDGRERVYLTPPDRQANEYLINRIMGKPTERRELTGAGGDPLFPESAQARMLADPEARRLACDLDERLAAEAPATPEAPAGGAPGGPDAGGAGP